MKKYFSDNKLVINILSRDAGFTENFFKKKLASVKSYYVYLHHNNAEVAQLVELQPSKLVVASSSLVFRSKIKPNLKRLGFLFLVISARINQYWFLFPRVPGFA